MYLYYRYEWVVKAFALKVEFTSVKVTFITDMAGAMNGFLFPSVLQEVWTVVLFSCTELNNLTCTDGVLYLKK
jgi:hypothetical protein